MLTELLFVTFESAEEPVVKWFSCRDTEVKIRKKFRCQKQRSFKTGVKLLVRLLCIFFWLECHHMSFQLCVMKRDFHEKPDQEAFESASTGEQMFVETHSPDCPFNFLLRKPQRTVSMINGVINTGFAGDDIPDGICDRQKTIPLQKIAVKLIFNYEMVVAGLFRLGDNVAVAFTVQYKVADVTKEIGIRAIVCASFLK